jgi:hypothetical protein
VTVIVSKQVLVHVTVSVIVSVVVSVTIVVLVVTVTVGGAEKVHTLFGARLSMTCLLDDTHVEQLPRHCPWLICGVGRSRRRLFL